MSETEIASKREYDVIQVVPRAYSWPLCGYYSILTRWCSIVPAVNAKLATELAVNMLAVKVEWPVLCLISGE